MTKILMVRTGKGLYGVGGANTRWYDIYNLLSRTNQIILLQPIPDKSIKDTISNTDETPYYFRSAKWNQYDSPFADFNVSYYYKFYQIIRKERPDVVIFSFPYGIIINSLIHPNLPLIYEAHDLNSDLINETGFKKLANRFSILKQPALGSIVKYVMHRYFFLHEKIACKRVMHILVQSDEDKSLFIKNYSVDEEKITVIPPSVEHKCTLPSRKSIYDKEEVIVGFHGSYLNYGNQEAFKLILNYVAPEVSRIEKRIRFLLAGTGVSMFEKDNVKSIGFVKDISLFLQQLDIAIVPLISGSGVKEKIFDYMGYGLPIITTKKGAQGIKLENNINAIITEAVNDQFIKAIIELANNPEKRWEFSRNIFELATHEYGRDTAQQKMDGLISRLLQVRSG